MRQRVFAAREAPLARRDTQYRASALADPRYPDPCYNAALLLEDRGEKAAATLAYERAIAADAAGSIPEARYNLGMLHDDAGELDDAIECYERALALRPGWEEAERCRR